MPAQARLARPAVAPTIPIVVKHNILMIGQPEVLQCFNQRCTLFTRNPVFRSRRTISYGQWTLGVDLAVWQSLARMQLLQVDDPDARVRAAAQLAEGRIRGNIACALGITPENLLFVSAAPANGLIYAATPDSQYAIGDSSNWRLVGALPDYPTALAAGGLDRQVAYLGTIGSGPFRSFDGGQTWERILTGQTAAERLSVTSIVVNPTEAGDVQQVTLAPAITVGSSELHTSPLCIFHTADGGNGWSLVAVGNAAHNQ